MNQPVAIPTYAEEIPAGRTGAARGPRGEPGGTTGFCTVGHEGFGRTNRGDSLEELDEGRGSRRWRPSCSAARRPRAEPGVSKARLRGLLRGLPPKLKEELEQVPDEGNPMVDMEIGAPDRHPNVDFSTTCADRRLGPPTLLFALARVTGRAAHVAAQRDRNRFISPTADDIGPEKRSFAPLTDREAGVGPRG